VVETLKSGSERRMIESLFFSQNFDFDFSSPPEIPMISVLSFLNSGRSFENSFASSVHPGVLSFG